jgi:hypothetical protein
MTRGRRIRHRRRLAAATGALAAVVAITLPITILYRADSDHSAPVASATTAQTDTTTPTGTTVPTARATASTRAATTATPPATVTDPRQINLPGGWRVTAAGRVALDAHGSYVPLPSNARLIQPAPAGYRVLTQTEPDAPLQIGPVGGAASAAVDPGRFNGTYGWSPTGDRVIAGYSEKASGESGFAIIDAATGNVTTHPVDRNRYDCSQCNYAFTRDGTEVVVAIADRSGGEAEERVLGLQFFNAGTGAPTRTVLAKVWVPSSPFAFSPDGRYLIAEGDTTPGKYVRVDLATRATTPFPYDAVWVTDSQLLAAEGLEALSLRADGVSTATTAIGIPDAGVPIVFGPPA